MGVNQSRARLEQNVTDAVGEAELIGFNGQGEACVWFGGYTFNVYDAARDWQEVRAFTSGELSGMTDKTSSAGRNEARLRIESEGFEVFRRQ